MSIITALVGCGHIHIRGFTERLAARDDVQVKYAWDHQRERAQKWGGPLGAQIVDDLDAIWRDDGVDAVIINAETDRHGPLVAAATGGQTGGQAGSAKHLFVEKPLGFSASDAYKMAAQIDDANVIFQTGYFMRGQPIHQFLRQQIADGAFGQITRFRHVNAHSGALGGWFDEEWRWMADLAQAGVGGFGDLGTHSLDILLWLMDAGPESAVESATASVQVATGRYGETDEYGEGLLQFEGGAIGSLAAGWVSIANPLGLEISGTEGHAYVRNGELFFQSEHVDGADGQSPWTDLPAAWPHAFELFLDAVIQQKESGSHDQPLVSAQEAARRSAVMEAMYEGAENGRWVSPSKE